MPILITVFIGLMAGIILATPPGVINLTIMNLLAQHRHREALWVGAGSATLDIFYGALAMFSTSAVYLVLQGFIEANPITMKTLEVIFVAGLVAVGLHKLRTKEGATSQDSRTKRVITKLNSFHPFIGGCLLALTHILVPTFLPGYAYLAALLIHTGWIPLSSASLWLFAFSFAAGNMLWVFFVVGLSKRFSHLVQARSYLAIDRGFGALFLTAGVLMSIRLLTTAVWAL